MNERHARELVARERTRIEALLAEQVGEIRADGSLQSQQSGESGDAATALDSESVSGTHGISVESGLPIPDERLEVEPLAERTIEEQRDHETHGSNGSGE